MDRISFQIIKRTKVLQTFEQLEHFCSTLFSESSFCLLSTRSIQNVQKVSSANFKLMIKSSD